MCDGNRHERSANESLHEKFCRLTHGIPCKTVAAIKALILGKAATSDCCSGHADGSSCGCGGSHAATDTQDKGGCGCGCGGKH